MSILEKVLRAGEGRMVRRLKAIADAVNSIEDDYVNLTDDELRGMTEQFKKRLADGETLDDLLPEAFAVAREAAARVLGQRPYDVQVMGAAALHFGIAHQEAREVDEVAAEIEQCVRAGRLRVLVPRERRVGVEE